MNEAGHAPPDLTLEVPPNPTHLAVVRMMIGLIAEAMGFTETESLQLELSVDEACSNSIAAVQEMEGETAGGVRIEITLLEQGLKIAVVDRGRDFADHFEKAVPFHDGTDRTRHRGYGLQIIKTCMDEVQYSHETDRGNRLVLTKYRARV